MALKVSMHEKSGGFGGEEEKYNESKTMATLCHRYRK